MIERIDMNLRILFVLIVMVLVSIKVQAEIIILKDGRMINTKVIEQDEKKIKIIDEDGEAVSYDKDEIQSVNGTPFVPAEQASNDVKLSGSGSEGTEAVPAIQEPVRSGLSKRALIRKFIDVIGTRESMTKNFDRMVATLPPDKAQEVRKILNVDEVIENILPLYDKYYTQDDLELYVAFFGSERGQKFLKALPLIMQESVDVNIEYFKTKMPGEFE